MGDNGTYDYFAILIVQYIEQITIKVMLEISLINCIGIAILSANQADIIALNLRISV